MKIFVLDDRFYSPHKNSEILASMVVEIRKNILGMIIDHWQQLDKEAPSLDASNLSSTSIQKRFKNTSSPNTFEQFLRRPYIVVHAGSHIGAEHCPQIRKDAREAGALVAAHGFSLLYGGGAGGLMGLVLEGFIEEMNKRGRRPDQYSVQVLPSEFVFGVRNPNGMRPANEGLCDITDAALILPDFAARRFLLNNCGVAAITCPGGIGSVDEGTDVLVHEKTGLGNIPLYFLNTYVEKAEKGFYQPLLDQLRLAVDCGLEEASFLEIVMNRVKKTPKKIFEDLMPKLEQVQALPDQVYQAYCQINGVKEGKAKTPRRTARSNKYRLIDLNP